MEKTNDFLEQILANGPSQSTVFMVLSEMKRRGQTSEVIQECLKALSIYTDDIRVRKLLAESYLDAGFVTLAEKELSRVTSDIDQLATVYKLNAQILARQGKHVAASESLKKFLSLNPEDLEALELLEKLCPAQSKTESSEITLGAEVALDKDIFSEQTEEVVDLATPTIAELYYNQGQHQRAIDTYEMILLNNPDDEKSKLRLSELKTSLRQTPDLKYPSKPINRMKIEKSIEILEGWLSRINYNFKNN